MSDAPALRPPEDEHPFEKINRLMCEALNIRCCPFCGGKPKLSQSGHWYVHCRNCYAAGAQGIISATAPVQVPVVTGISDNSNIQILSGLTEGQQIVTSTRTGSAVTTSTATGATTRTSGGNAGFGGGGGGGAVIRGL